MFNENNFVVIVKLVCTFVFVYSNCWFSHAAYCWFSHAVINILHFEHYLLCFFCFNDFVN